MEANDLFEDFFNPIARDGASIVEVQLRLQAALQALATNEPTRFGSVARAHATLAAARAEDALEVEHDRVRLRHAAAWLRPDRDGRSLAPHAS